MERSVTGAVAWTYDADFRITEEQVRGGHAATFGYDNDGLLMSAGATTVTRAPATGLLQSSTVGSVATTFGYNGLGVASHATTAGGTPAYAATLGRDAGGRTQQQAEVLGGVTTTDVYGYDLAGRLQTVTRNGALVVTYGYDANGNRNAVTTAGGTTSATFDAQDRIQTFGTRTYTHTPHGDVAAWTDSATSTTTALTYDVQRNLRQVARPGTTVTYTVDGRNRRIGTAVNGTPVQGLLWQGQLRPVAELDGSGALVSRFVYGTRINVPEYLVKNGTTYRVVTDHLGSVRLVVDTSTNAVVQALAYDPWGVVVQDTNPGFQPFGYAGGLYDFRTGLVRFGVRDYDATIGRWLAKDPIGFDGETGNLFVYSALDPINNHDYNGLIAIQIGGAVYGAISGGVGGYIASGTFEGAAVGALAGAVVGLINPLSGLAGGFVTGTGASLVGQVAGNVRACRDWSTIDYEAALFAGVSGSGSGSLARQLANPHRSAFAYQSFVRFGSGSAVGTNVMVAMVEGFVSGVTEAFVSYAQRSLSVLR